MTGEEGGGTTRHSCRLNGVPIAAATCQMIAWQNVRHPSPSCPPPPFQRRLFRLSSLLSFGGFIVCLQVTSTSLNLLIPSFVSLPALYESACFRLFFNISRRLLTDISRLEGWQRPPDFQRNAHGRAALAAPTRQRLQPRPAPLCRPFAPYLYCFTGPVSVDIGDNGGALRRNL